MLGAGSAGAVAIGKAGTDAGSAEETDPADSTIGPTADGAAADADIGETACADISAGAKFAGIGLSVIDGIAGIGGTVGM